MPTPARDPVIAEMIASAMSSTGGGAPPRGVDTAKAAADDGKMNERISALEAKWGAVIPTLATKSDIEGTKASIAEMRAEVAKGFADQTKWIVGTGIVGMVAFVTIMTFVLNNATPKAPAAAAQPPIIINVPGAAAAPAPGASRP
jgi:hypothetical protein